MVPTLAFIQEKFKKYNVLMFQNKLPMLPIRMGNARTALGGIRYSKRRNFFGKVRYENFRMVISTYYDLPEHEVEDTLIHEMIHYYILYHQIHDSSAHGEVFHRMMNDINRNFGRHISVSHHSPRLASEAKECIRSHYLCICELQDGTIGITVSAKTRVFELWKLLPKCFQIRKMTWYGSTDPYFNRFPHAIKPKMYLVDEAEVKEHLQSAVELLNDGYCIKPK